MLLDSHFRQHQYMDIIYNLSTNDMKNVSQNRTQFWNNVIVHAYTRVR